MRPDFGTTLHATGFRGKVVAGFEVQAIAEYGRFREVTGMVCLDNETLCATVRTKQTTAQIVRARDAAGGVWAEGRLAPGTEIGASGEVYRVIIGRVRLNAQSTHSPGTA